MAPRKFDVVAMAVALSCALPPVALSADAYYFRYKGVFGGVVGGGNGGGNGEITIEFADHGFTGVRVGKAFRQDFKNLVTALQGSTAIPPTSLAWSLGSAAAHPPGLVPSESNSVLEGNPTQAGDYDVTVQATYGGQQGQKVYRIKVGNAVLEVIQISAGQYHTCAVTASRGVKCWGHGLNGKLGNNGVSDSAIPVDVVGLSSGVSMVVAGYHHSCAVTLSGQAWCWGKGAQGQLGDGNNAETHHPVLVANLTSVSSITLGLHHTCAINSGQAWCWGHGAFGQLGVYGDNTNKSLPQSVHGLSSGVTNLSAGDNHTCGAVGGVAKCWGRNDDGEIGNGNTGFPAFEPADVFGLGSGVISISAGFKYSCAVLTSGAVQCWGRNDQGQLGDGSNSPSGTPRPVSGIASGATSVSLGHSHTCAVVSGNLMCWGNNASGQFGNGGNSGSTTPTPVDPGVVFSSVNATEHTSCGVMNDGAGMCWGANGYGQLGNGDTSASNVPVEVVSN